MRTLTPERQKLRQDAIRLRQELSWSERAIAVHLRLPQTTIHRWLNHNSIATLNHNSPPPALDAIYVMDCLEGLRRLPHDDIDLVFADPPYNLGVNYGNGNGSDRHEAYLDWCAEWFKAVERVLKPGGSFYVIHYPEVCADWLPRLRAIRFQLQRWITWHYPTNIGQSPRNWTRAHRAILFCTKGEGYTFHGLADPQPYRNPTDRRIKDHLAAGREGVTPYDVWEYNLVKNVSKEKGATPNQLPEALLRRIILTSSKEGDIILDPFVGSGTTAVVAKREKRRYLGFDINPTFIEQARRRLHEV